MPRLLIVECSDSFSDSYCTTDCEFWANYGCESNFPSDCSTSGKVKEYCSISCNTCGRLLTLRVQHTTLCAKIISYIAYTSGQCSCHPAQPNTVVLTYIHTFMQMSPRICSEPGYQDGMGRAYPR